MPRATGVLRDRLVVASRTRDVDTIGLLDYHAQADGQPDRLLLDGVDLLEWFAWAAASGLNVRVTLRVVP